MFFKEENKLRYRRIVVACKWITGIVLACVAVSMLPLCYLGYLATLTAGLIAGAALILGIVMQVGLSMLKSQLKPIIFLPEPVAPELHLKSVINEIKKTIRKSTTKESLDTFVDSWNSKEPVCELKNELLIAINELNAGDQVKSIVDDLNAVLNIAYQWSDTDQLIELLIKRQSQPTVITEPVQAPERSDPVEKPVASNLTPCLAPF